MTKVKICGITNYNDAKACIDCGADAIGFIFYEKSRRYIEPEQAFEIIRKLPPFITKVGVFVNSLKIRIANITNQTRISAIQLHGDETPDFCLDFMEPVIKALRIKDLDDLENIASFPVQAILLDTFTDAEYGGTGKSFDWNILKDLNSDKNIILSGGLNPDNIEDAIIQVNPYAVDVSSGVEKSPGIKDHSKIKKFIEAVRNAEKI